MLAGSNVKFKPWGIARSKFKIGGDSVWHTARVPLPPILNFERATPSASWTAKSDRLTSAKSAYQAMRVSYARGLGDLPDGRYTCPPFAPKLPTLIRYGHQLAEMPGLVSGVG